MTLKIHLTIEPRGHKTKAYDIGFIEICNVTGLGRMSSDYLWRIHTNTHALRHVEAEGYIVDSINVNAVELLYDVLSEWKSGRTQPIDNHGMSRASPEGIDVSAKELWRRLDQAEENTNVTNT